MSEIRFLSLENVLRIHESQFAQKGGSPGLRDIGLLELALAMPRAGFGGEYLHSDLFEMAAAYLFHIAKNHPFVDGNKRTALVSALVFLDLNGVRAEAPDRALEDLVVGVADGTVPKSAVAEFLRRHGKGR